MGEESVCWEFYPGPDVPYFDSYYSILGKDDYLASNEQKTIEFLEEVSEKPYNFLVATFSRTALTKAAIPLRHSLLVFYNKEYDSYSTLSFNGTNSAVSEGAWLINTKTDVDSFCEYIDINLLNGWNMTLEYDSSEIDLMSTVNNIRKDIYSDNTYAVYAVINYDNKQNCTSALKKILSLKEE